MSSVPLADDVDSVHAESRFRRLAVFLLGMSVTAYTAIDLPTVAAQAAEYPSWWTPAALTVQFVFGASFLVLPWVAPWALVARVAAAYAVIGVVGMVALIPALGFGGLPDESGAPWILRANTHFALAGALAVRPVLAWLLTALVAVLEGVVRWATAASHDALQAVEDLVVTASVTFAIVAGLLALVAASRSLDRAAIAAVRAAREDAAEAATTAERMRVQLLAHDAVLHTLRAASLGVQSATVTPTSLARETLDRLDRLSDPDLDEAPGERPVDDFVRRLRSLTTTLAPDAVFTHRSDDGTVPTLPAEAATALLEASGEALRNSVAHAGPGAHRRVEVATGPGITVTVRDDGAGFRTRGGSPRLGVSRSIIGRMAATAGGRSSIRSRPGRGSTVELGWDR